MTNLQKQLEVILHDLMESECDLMNIVANINSYNGSLEHLRYESNDEEFFNIYFGGDVLGAVRAVFYGEYNYNDDYVKFNAYNNLISKDKWEVEQELVEDIDEIASELINLVGSVSTGEEIIDVLIELFANGDDYIQEISLEDFKKLLINDYGLDELLENEITNNTTQEELDEILTTLDFCYQAITDSLEIAVECLESNCKLFQVKDMYIVFDA